MHCVRSSLSPLCIQGWLLYQGLCTSCFCLDGSSPHFCLFLYWSVTCFQSGPLSLTCPSFTWTSFTAYQCIIVHLCWDWVTIKHTSQPWALHVSRLFTTLFTSSEQSLGISDTQPGPLVNGRHHGREFCGCLTPLCSLLSGKDFGREKALGTSFVSRWKPCSPEASPSGPTSQSCEWELCKLGKLIWLPRS